MTSVDGNAILPVLSLSSVNVSRKTNAASVSATGRPCKAFADRCLDENLDDVGLTSSLDGFHANGIEPWRKLDSMPALGIENMDSSRAVELNMESISLEDIAVIQACEVESNKATKPFHKWIRTLHRRALQRQSITGVDLGESRFGHPMHHGVNHRGRYHHRKSSSGSSTGFVTAVKSASVSLASASLLTRSRRNTLRSLHGHARTDRSSRASFCGARLSMDSTNYERPPVMDPAITERSLQRRRILEELISTEEGYIGDVRFLMNVYITILASLPTLSTGLRSSINRNLTDIVELHEELLGDLHRVVPHSEYTQLDLPPEATKPECLGPKHQRWRSLDAVPEDRVGMSWLQNIPGMTAEPQVAAEVAKVFSKKMKRFFIYEEYGAKYELMIKDVASAHRTMPRWESYQKGLETLAAALDAANNQGDNSKKSLTIGDLLVKPIQRVCKYPLLFAELLKYSPVCDCPQSHMEIENTLIRLREATAEINRATDDSRIKATLEKTWILQDRLVFSNQSLDATSKNQIRSFGHVQLCGALHICWQTRDGVHGQYMVALLYHEWLCLALAGRVDQIYTIQACISLSHAKIEEVDNGRGIQCHTAPYSWKLVFICDHQLYEVIMTACTSKEEHEWRSRLSRATPGDPQNQTQTPLFNSLSLNIKALGAVFGKPGTIARRLSIHRATTVGPKTPLCQVILKNTSVVKDAPRSSSSSPINRSQSLLTTNSRIPVLAPSRGERARLEALLSDVWTRDILPFPGITTRSRSEYLVKASASSVMRKLSVASIASNFTKRSVSVASLHKTEGDGAATTGPGQPKSAVPVLSIDGEANGEQESEWAADVLRTVRRLTEIKMEGDCIAKEIPAFRPSPPANPTTKRHDSGSTRLSTCGSEKESIYSVRRVRKTSLKAQRRWVKVGGIQRDIVVQGFRSLFR